MVRGYFIDADGLTDDSFFFDDNYFWKEKSGLQFGEINGDEC